MGTVSRWLPSAEPSTDPGHLFGQYRSRLMTLGLMEGEVDGYLAVVATNMRTRNDGWRGMSNWFGSLQSTEREGGKTSRAAPGVRALLEWLDHMVRVLC